MDFVLTQSGTPQIALPPVADLGYAATLKATLVEALDLRTGLDVDAGEVQRITAPCLQILVAAAKSFGEAGGPPLTFSKASPEFWEAAKLLAIAGVLGAKGE